jgi:hypothetical protein
MPELSLDFLSGHPEAQTLVRQMLSAVVDYPGVHRNWLNVRRGRDGSWQYFVGQKGAQSAYPQYQSLSIPLFPSLSTHGWIEPKTDENAPAETWRFTEGALAWHKQKSAPAALTAHQVQRRIGEALFERYAKGSGPLDLDVLAEQIGITRGQLDLQLDLLIRLEFAQRRPPIGHSDHIASFPEEGDVQLTTKGLLWANSDLPPITMDRVPVVNVHAHVALDVTPLLRVLPLLSLPPETRAEAEELAEELQEPTIEKVGKLMELGANTKELLLPVFQVLVGNADKIGHVLQQLT